jgi:hypothetical protein
MSCYYKYAGEVVGPGTKKYSFEGKGKIVIQKKPALKLAYAGLLTKIYLI